MTVKFLLGAAAIVGALSLGVPAMAADNGDMAKPMVHHRHHHAMHHTMHHEMHHATAHHRMRHADMSVEQRERAETEKLNRDQLH